MKNSYQKNQNELKWLNVVLQRSKKKLALKVFLSLTSSAALKMMSSNWSSCQEAFPSLFMSYSLSLSLSLCHSLSLLSFNFSLCLFIFIFCILLLSLSFTISHSHTFFLSLILTYDLWLWSPKYVSSLFSFYGTFFYWSESKYLSLY